MTLKSTFSLVSLLAGLSFSVAARIELDGQITPNEWQGATEYHQFRITSPDIGTSPEWPTQVKVLTQDAGLYLAFISYQPESSRSRKYSATDQYTEAYWVSEIFIPWTLVPFPVDREKVDETVKLHFSRYVIAKGEQYSFPDTSASKADFLQKMQAFKVNRSQDSAFSLFPYLSGQLEKPSDIDVAVKYLNTSSRLDFGLMAVREASQDREGESIEGQNVVSGRYLLKGERGYLGQLVNWLEDGYSGEQALTSGLDFGHWFSGAEL